MGKGWFGRRRFRDQLVAEARARAAALGARIGPRLPPFVRRLVPLGAELGSRIEIDDISTHAGALAYAAFLSIPPLVLSAIAVVGFVVSGSEHLRQPLIDHINDLVPRFADVLTAGVRSPAGGRVTLGVAGLVGLLWTGSGFVSRARKALGQVFGLPTSGAIVRRVKGMAAGLIVVLAIPVLAAVASAATWVHRLTGWALTIGVPFTAGLILVQFVSFLGAYRLLTPRGGPRFREHVPGAALLTVAWQGLGLAGSLVFGRLAVRSTALYGGIGAVFALLLLLYVGMWLLLVGAETTSMVRSRRLASPAAPGEAPDEMPHPEAPDPSREEGGPDG